MRTHHRVTADTATSRERQIHALRLPSLLATVSAHRRRRGPYTAAGSLLRAIAPDLLVRCPELGRRHRIEIAETAPELAHLVPTVPWTLAEVVSSDERRRYPARLHTFRVANGLVELLRDYLLALGSAPHALVIHDVQEGDYTDQEFLAVLLRRMPADLLTVVICTTSEPWVDPPGPLQAPLSATFDRWMSPAPLTCEPAPADPSPKRASAVLSPDQRAGLIRDYVDSECLSDDPLARAAYQDLDPAARAALHDRRASQLRERAEPSLLLGAVPFHLERGSDPAGAGADALRAAQVRCRNLGFYHYAAEVGERGRALLDPQRDWVRWWALSGGMTMALASSGRAGEAKAYHDEARRLSCDPEVHMHLAYATGLLFTRHFAEDQRDHDEARGWLNLSIAIAELLPDPGERTFYSVFNRNGLALVEMRQGRTDEAVRLVTEGLGRLDRELAPEVHRLHRAGLRYNRAQVYAILGRLEEALADYTTSVEHDGSFADHYFNRAAILRRLGRLGEALADYDHAAELSPPCEEVHFNRGAVRLELGDLDGAAADFVRVVELDPGNLDARLNLASVRSDLGDAAGARAEVDTALAIDPTHPHLLCLRGQLLAEAGELAGAEESLVIALRHDPSLAQAWALRGEVAFAAGDLVTAQAHLDRAVELDPAAAVLFNRAVVHEASGRYAEAVTDLDRVLALSDDEDARELRAAAAHRGGQPQLTAGRP